MAVERIEILGVPVDVCQPQNLEKEIMRLLEKPGTKQIIFMNIWDLLKARKKNDYSECVKNADLIIPISKSILRGAKFLKKTVPVRYNPFEATIRILTILEKHYKSFYLLGGKRSSLMTAEHNVRQTFPNLQIVGRYIGYTPKSIEDNIVQAIYKASPSLVLLSEGIKEKEVWAFNHRNQFSSSIFMYYQDAIGIFSERKSRISEKKFNKGLEIWSEILRNPFKIFLIFPYIYYLFSLLFARIFKK